MIGITEEQVKQMVKREIDFQLGTIRHDWESAFERKDRLWEVGTAYYLNSGGQPVSSQVILRKKVETPSNYAYTTDPSFYREQVVDISLPSLLLALMKHCGLEFEVTPAIKRAAEVKIVKHVEVQP